MPAAKTSRVDKWARWAKGDDKQHNQEQCCQATLGNDVINGQRETEQLISATSSRHNFVVSQSQ